MKWSVSKKISLILGLPILLMVITGISTYLGIQALLELNQGVNQTFWRRQYLSDFEIAMLRSSSGMRGYLATGNQEFLADFNKSLVDWEAALRNLQDLMDDPQSKIRLEKVAQISNKVLQFRKDVFDFSMNQGIEAGQHKLAEGGIHALEADLEHALASYNTRRSEVLDERMSQAERGAGKTLAFVVVGTLLAAIASLLVGSLVARGITLNMKRVTDIAEEAAKGNLSLKTGEVKSSDEVGQLVRSFNTMIEGVRELVKAAFSGASQVAATSQQVSSSAQEMNATAEEVSASVQQISKGTEIQAKKIEETSKVMDQMKQSVELVSSNASAATEVSNKTQEAALRGGDETKKAIEKMNKIYDVVSQSGLVVQKLGKRSTEIGEIVTVITEIADQTNLLALNAAIEAARAGEAGRGFAVVADEVRKLAESSSAQAEAINKLIKEIQSETQSAVRAMQDGTREVTEGRDIVTKSGEALGDIIEMARQSFIQVQKIAKATQDQLSSVNQVTQYMADISTSAEQTASATQQSSASTEEMTASMEEMATSAQSLADMSLDLKTAVSKFNIGEEIPKQDFIPKRRTHYGLKKSFKPHFSTEHLPQPGRLYTLAPAGSKPPEGVKHEKERKRS
jgi:methyl-accepting chemotaxis protein